jgi:hypothetical protein
MILFASNNDLWESLPVTRRGAVEWEKLFTAKKQLSSPRRAVKGGKTSDQSVDAGWRGGSGPPGPAIGVLPGAGYPRRKEGRWALPAKPQRRAARRGTRPTELLPHSGSKRWQIQGIPCLSHRGHGQILVWPEAICPNFYGVLPQSGRPRFPLVIGLKKLLSRTFFAKSHCPN